MLRSEDRRRDGVYRYEVDQEGLANTEATVWWELALLEQRHYDEEVRAEANRLSRWSKDE
jgi:nucleolar complex protein 3